MTDASSPDLNVLLLVLDACRADYAEDHASNLGRLADENVVFENAISPAPWSLPAHGSVFTGELPHQHGMTQLNDAMEHSLIEVLSKQGYHCAGVSSNGFASQRTGFDTPFDEFDYVGGRDPYADGMDVSGTAQEVLRQDGSGYFDALIIILQHLPSEAHKFRSLVNLAAVASGELATSFDALQRVPHPWFAPDSGYSYNPEKMTATIKPHLSESTEPFFLFMNYMDTHHPYTPPSGRQQTHIGKTLSYREMRRINETVASPWEFVSGIENETISKEQIQTVRQLYAGEVETVDEHIGRILAMLSEHGLRDETLLIVTADHGENLGEHDDMGRQRMGHEGSVSDAVLEVPLVIAHPELEARKVTDRVSIKNLYALLTNGIQQFIDSGGQDLGPLASDGPVISQYPATGGTQIYEKYPDAPKAALRYRTEVDTVVAYNNEWKVVVSSNGERWARHEGQEVEFDSVPRTMRETCIEQVKKLQSIKNTDEELTEADVSQLEALGYM